MKRLIAPLSSLFILLQQIKSQYGSATIHFVCTLQQNSFRHVLAKIVRFCQTKQKIELYSQSTQTQFTPQNTAGPQN